jgi:hypothetical protein
MLLTLLCICALPDRKRPVMFQHCFETHLRILRNVFSPQAYTFWSEQDVLPVVELCGQLQAQALVYSLIVH